jgi:hypothetical protein
VPPTADLIRHLPCLLLLRAEQLLRALHHFAAGRRLDFSFLGIFDLSLIFDLA